MLRDGEGNGPRGEGVGRDGRLVGTSLVLINEEVLEVAEVDLGGGALGGGGREEGVEVG